MTNETSSPAPSRRRFIQSMTATAAAGMALPAMAIPTPSPAKWDQEFDLVVVGAGGAGLAAAVEAVGRGLSVVVLEKTPIVGGSSTICGGQYSCAGSYLQKERKVEDSNDIFIKDMMTTGGGVNDIDLVKAYVPESLLHFNWLVAQGVKPTSLNAAAGMSVPRAHVFDPSEVIRVMREYVTKKGAKILLQTAAERLVWDDKTKSIAGITAKSRGKVLTIAAKKGVLLAAGGFSRNPKLLQQYSPPMAKAAVIAGLGTQGDGILMAQAYGAAMIDTSYIKATYGFRLNPSTITDMTLVYYMGGIMVNKTGKRFVKESLSYKLLGDAALTQPDAASYIIFDEAMRTAQMKAVTYEVKLFGGFDGKGAEPKDIFRANTLGEAAKKAGLDPVAVEETVKRYNGYVDQGKDPEFGRDTLTSGFGKLVKIEKGPFYVMPATAALIATYCGLKINPKAQVLDVFGEPIKKLYAAGEMTGGVHGAAYMTGTAFSKAMVFGRLATRAIAGA